MKEKKEKKPSKHEKNLEKERKRKNFSAKRDHE